MPKATFKIVTLASTLPAEAATREIEVDYTYVAKFDDKPAHVLLHNMSFLDPFTLEGMPFPRGLLNREQLRAMEEAIIEAHAS